jgi:hypothetical protein
MCEHVNLPDGSVAIVCGMRRRKRQRCSFCGAPANKLCDFKIEKATDIPSGRLRMGDVIETRQKKFHLPVRMISRFRPYGIPRQALVRITMYGLQFPDGRCFLYYLHDSDKARVLRPGTCDKPCCEKCSREAGENVDYCMDHWRVWEFQPLDQRQERQPITEKAKAAATVSQEKS